MENLTCCTSVYKTIVKTEWNASTKTGYLHVESCPLISVVDGGIDKSMDRAMIKDILKQINPKDCDVIHAEIIIYITDLLDISFDASYVGFNKSTEDTINAEYAGVIIDYTGRVYDYRPHGAGKMIITIKSTKDKFTLEGTFKHGLLHGLHCSVCYYADDVLCERLHGAFKNGLPHEDIYYTEVDKLDKTATNSLFFNNVTNVNNKFTPFATLTSGYAAGYGNIIRYNINTGFTCDIIGGRYSICGAAIMEKYHDRDNSVTFRQNGKSWEVAEITSSSAPGYYAYYDKSGNCIKYANYTHSDVHVRALDKEYIIKVPVKNGKHETDTSKGTLCTHYKEGVLINVCLLVNDGSDKKRFICDSCEYALLDASGFSTQKTETPYLTTALIEELLNEESKKFGSITNVTVRDQATVPSIQDTAPSTQGTQDTMPNIQSTQDTMPNIQSTQDTMPNIQSTQNKVPNIQSTQNKVPNIQNVMPNIQNVMPNIQNVMPNIQDIAAPSN
jgi:hypothetical protein